MELAEARKTLHRVLFVDDDAAFLDVVSQVFAARAGGAWEIRCATDGAQALTLLQAGAFDLVVMDIRLPVVDGQQVLQLLHRRYPHLRKAVLTGCADAATRTECLNAGAELFLEKPASAGGLENVFAALDELLHWQPEEGFQGVLRKVGLQDVIQMECLGRSSSVLEITGQGGRGRLYIRNGAVIHAEAGERRGEAAFHFLLGLKGGAFHLRPYTEPPEHTIDAQWEFLLMEAARQRDESAEMESVSAAPPEPPPLPPMVERAPATRRIDEIMACTADGEVLFEWQCPQVEARVKLFQLIAERAERLAQVLPLGEFDRLEIVGPRDRIVAQIQPEFSLLVRSSPRTPRVEGAGERGLLQWQG
jgi:CheY-like chemotaxis protein